MHQHEEENMCVCVCRCVCVCGGGGDTTTIRYNMGHNSLVKFKHVSSYSPSLDHKEHRVSIILSTWIRTGQIYFEEIFNATTTTNRCRMLRLRHVPGCERFPTAASSSGIWKRSKEKPAEWTSKISEQPLNHLWDLHIGDPLPVRGAAGCSTGSSIKHRARVTRVKRYKRSVVYYSRPVWNLEGFQKALIVSTSNK